MRDQLMSFVTYGRRLAAAASAAGLTVDTPTRQAVSPGQRRVGTLALIRGFCG
jgi:hypothetical protein